MLQLLAILWSLFVAAILLVTGFEIVRENRHNISLIIVGVFVFLMGIVSAICGAELARYAIILITQFPTCPLP